MLLSAITDKTQQLNKYTRFYTTQGSETAVSVMSSKIFTGYIHGLCIRKRFCRYISSVISDQAWHWRKFTFYCLTGHPCILYVAWNIIIFQFCRRSDIAVSRKRNTRSFTPDGKHLEKTNSLVMDVASNNSSFQIIKGLDQNLRSIQN